MTARPLLHVASGTDFMQLPIGVILTHLLQLRTACLDWLVSLCHNYRQHVLIDWSASATITDSMF